MATNTLWVVQGHDHPWLMSDRLSGDRCQLGQRRAPPEPGTRLTAKTRYRQADAACTVSGVAGGRFELAFDEPQWAVTPGQSAVLYRGRS